MESATFATLPVGQCLRATTAMPVYADVTDRKSGLVRGIYYGLVISVPLWAVIAGTLAWLLR